jgi:hypothetical protein
VLLDQLLLRNRQLIPQEKVLQRVLMKDVIHMQIIAPHLKVEPEFSSSQSIKGPGSAPKVTQGFPGMSELRSFQAADRVNRLQLGVQVELVQLVHRLI